MYSLGVSKGKTATTEAENVSSAEQKIPSPVTDRVTQMNKELERTGVALDTVLSRYQISSVEEMTDIMFTNAMNSLKKTKKKVA